MRIQVVRIRLGTLLRALINEIPYNERIVTIESAAELRLQQRHVVCWRQRVVAEVNATGPGHAAAFAVQYGIGVGPMHSAAPWQYFAFRAFEGFFIPIEHKHLF